MSDILKWIGEHKDALDFLLGPGIFVVLLGALIALGRWLWKLRRAHQVREETFPFEQIPPNSDVARVILPHDEYGPLSDRAIPYQQRIQGRDICAELEEKLKEKRWLLILGRTGLGKTREALHLAQKLNREGWTVLNLKPDGWVDAPARLPKELCHTRRLLFFLDDLNRRVYASRVEQAPTARDPTQPLIVPFPIRLQRTLETYEKLCGAGEIRVIATARDETTRESPDEPSEWEKLEWDRYLDLWKRFAVYHLPEPDNQAQESLLVQAAKRAGVQVEDAPSLARSNDGTFANLVANLQIAYANNQPLTKETFRPTLKGTWEERYRRAVDRFPTARFLYDAVDLLRNADIPLEPVLVWGAVWLLAKERWWLRRLWTWWQSGAALRYLMRVENILHPRDGQIEAKGRSIDWRPYAQPLTSLVLLWSHLVPRQALDTIFSFGARLHEAKEYQRCRALYQRGIAIAPRNAALWNNLGTAYGELGRYEEAIAAYKQAVARDEKLAAPWNGLGYVYAKQGRYEEAIAAYQQAVARDEKDATPWHNLGNVYAKQGRHEEAIAAYKQAAARDEKEATPWNNLGYVYDKLGRYEEAIAAYKEAIARDEKLAQPWDGLGNVYDDLGRYEEAIAAYQKAVARDEKLASPWNGLGNVYDKLGRYEEAIAAYQKAIAIDPASESAAFAYNNMADVYIEQEQFDQARHALHERIRLYPGNTFAPLITLGVLARHEGLPESNERFQQALAQWDKAWQERLQSVAELLEKKAIALLCLGQKGEALSTLAEALRQRLPGQTIDFTWYELLRTAPHPPDGVEEMIAMLKKAKNGG